MIPTLRKKLDVVQVMNIVMVLSFIVIPILFVITIH